MSSVSHSVCYNPICEQGALRCTGAHGQINRKPAAITAATKVKLARKAQADYWMELDGDERRWSSERHRGPPLMTGEDSLRRQTRIIDNMQQLQSVFPDKHNSRCCLWEMLESYLCKFPFVIFLVCSSTDIRTELQDRCTQQYAELDTHRPHLLSPSCIPHHQQLHAV